MVEIRTDDVVRCELCGEPMPPNEDMFKFHGYSGSRPKPPKVLMERNTELAEASDAFNQAYYMVVGTEPPWITFKEALSTIFAALEGKRIFDSMVAIVQYRMSEDSEIWHAAAIFDDAVLAEEYLERTLTKARPWEYRVVKLPMR